MTPLIAIKNLHFQYPVHSGKPLFNGHEKFGMNSEEKWLLGPSGSGKSTLLNLISGEILPNEGTLNVLGHDSTSNVRRRTSKFFAFRTLDLFFRTSTSSIFECA